MGHTNRELRRLRFDTGAKPTPGIRILAVDTDDDAGLITSVSPLSTATGQTIALGYLKTRYSKPDTPVRVLLGNDSRVGTVF
jgi:glycine cleavage system aminomethyltransferase T